MVPVHFYVDLTSCFANSVLISELHFENNTIKPVGLVKKSHYQDRTILQHQSRNQTERMKGRVPQSDPAISNTQGKQKLVRYNRDSLHPNIYSGKSNQKEMENRSI